MGNLNDLKINEDDLDLLGIDSKYLNKKLVFRKDKNSDYIESEDDSEIIIQEIQNIKLNLISEIFEAYGLPYGFYDEALIEYHNYILTSKPFYSIEGFLSFEAQRMLLFNIPDLDAFKKDSKYSVIKFEEITPELIKEIIPGANLDYVRPFLEQLDRYNEIKNHVEHKVNNECPDLGGYDENGIWDENSPIGKILIVAQAAVESASFSTLEEIGRGGGRQYGNEDRETHKVYYGRGHIQVTGKSNYEKINKLLQEFGDYPEDIVKNPDILVEKPEYGARASLCWFILNPNAIKCANNGDVIGLTKAINGNGATEKTILHRKQMTMLIYETAYRYHNFTNDINLTSPTRFGINPETGRYEMIQD